jgi:hypothetical protein
VDDDMTPAVVQILEIPIADPHRNSHAQQRCQSVVEYQTEVEVEEAEEMEAQQEGHSGVLSFGELPPHLSYSINRLSDKTLA